MDPYLSPDEAAAEVVEVLQRIGPCSVTRLLRHVRMADEHLVPVLRSLRDRGTLSFDGVAYSARRVASTSQMSALAERIFSPHDVLDAQHGGKVLVEDLGALAQKRPAEKRVFLQRHVSLRTSVLRALYLQHRGDLAGKRVVLLGDDDLTSLALCLVGGFDSLTVLELDAELNAFIESRFEELGASKARAVTYDAREPLPLELRGAADTFMCDPARRTYRTFLGRGQELLRPDGALYVFVNPSHSSGETQFVFQRLAIETGMIITDSVPGFNEYLSNPSKLGAEDWGYYPAPPNPDDAIAFTETLVRFEWGIDPEDEKRLFEAVESRG